MVWLTDFTVRSSSVLIYALLRLFPCLPQNMRHIEMDVRLLAAEDGGGPFCGGPSLVINPLL